MLNLSCRKLKTSISSLCESITDFEMTVSTIAAATNPPNDSEARTNQEKNRQNDKDYEGSWKVTLKKYQLSRFVKAFKKQGITLDELVAMDEEALHKLEDDIIGAAILKRKNFQRLIRGESMTKNYQSKYVKNNSNVNPVCFIFCG